MSTPTPVPSGPPSPTGNPRPPVSQPTPAVKVVNPIVKTWMAVRSNPYFVAFEGGVTGVAVNFIDDALRTGKIDFSLDGLHKLATLCAVGGLTAVRLLYRPTQTSQPNKE
jgi:hypothetical protein